MIEQGAFQYLNDWHYLQLAREHALQNRGMYDNPDMINATFCRLLAVQIVGSVEAMLQFNRDRFGEENYGVYFGRGTSNNRKIEILAVGISNLWNQVDYEIITDFIAIKIIRNGIVHSRELETNSEFLSLRQFPDNPNLLNETHWNRMCIVYREMLRYLIGMTSI